MVAAAVLKVAADGRPSCMAIVIEKVRRRWQLTIAEAVLIMVVKVKVVVALETTGRRRMARVSTTVATAPLAAVKAVAKSAINGRWQR